jgi:hypothetical protein
MTLASTKPSPQLSRKARHSTTAICPLEPDLPLERGGFIPVTFFLVITKLIKMLRGNNKIIQLKIVT